MTTGCSCNYSKHLTEHILASGEW